jgi:hypothetical protein
MQTPIKLHMFQVASAIVVCYDNIKSCIQLQS